MPPGNTKNKGGRMMSLINYRLKITLNDGRNLIGQMLAFDKHMNLVLAECEEFRQVKARKSKDAAASETPAAPQEMKRTLGLVILRGETVVSISIEGPPPKPEDETALAAGPGKGMPAGRGMGLGGAGIPPPSMAARPMPYARPPPGFPGMPGMPMGGMPPPGFPGAPPPGAFGRPPMGFPGAPPPGFPPQGFPPGMRPPM